MAAPDNFYSRLVVWLKITLPLAALGLLSTLFLISHPFDPTNSTAEAPIDLVQRARDQGVTNPTFAGVTRGGDQIRFKARFARPEADNPRRLLAQEVNGQLILTSGDVIDISSDRADMDHDANVATLEGSVNILMTTGYHVTLEKLRIHLDQLYAESPGPVKAIGPPGDLTAGHMILRKNRHDGRVQFLFTRGVKLLYQPSMTEE